MSFRGAGSRKFLPDILSTVGSKELRYPVQQSLPLQLDVPGDTLRPKVDLPGLTWAWFPGPCDPEAQASEFSHYVWLGVSVQAAKDLGESVSELGQPRRAPRDVNCPGQVGGERFQSPYLGCHGRIGGVDVDDSFDVGRELRVVVNSDVRHRWFAAVVLDDYVFSGKARHDTGRHPFEIPDRPLSGVPSALL
jgi:hypothetical protein